MFLYLGMPLPPFTECGCIELRCMPRSPLVIWASPSLVRTHAAVGHIGYVHIELTFYDLLKLQLHFLN